MLVRSTITLGLALAAAPALAQTCGGVEIFPSAGGYSLYSLHGVSGDGVTLFGNYGGLPTEQGFTWTEAGGLNVLSSGTFDRSTVSGASQDGSALVGWAATSGGFSRPVRWGAGGAIEELVDPSGASVYARASLVSDDGSVVAGTFFGGSLRPFRWTAAGGVEQLRDAHGATFLGSARDMTPDGAVIIGWGRIGGGAFNGFRWTASTGAVPIGRIFGEPQGTFDCRAISADGSTIVGSMSAPGFVEKPFVWTAATGVIDVYPGQTEPRAALHDVNEDGTLAIGDERLPSNLEQTILWAPEVGLQRLEPISFGWINAFSISEVGGIVVGQSRNPPYVGASVMLELSPLGATYCTESPVNSTGCFARLHVTGRRSVARNDVTLRARGVPPGAVGLFAVGTNAVVLPQPGGNVGTFCLDVPLARFARSGRLQNVGTNGEMSLALDLNDLPGGLAAQAGTTLYFQGWYQETLPAGTQANFTDAVAVTFE